MSKVVEELRTKLKEQGYKMTPQRKEIMKIFEEQGGHKSAEDVYMQLQKRESEIGLATVYRTLELMSELGLLVRVDFGDGCARYELNSGQRHQHHHLICLNCKKVEEFEEDLLEDLEANIALKSGFEIKNHEVKFYGYCRECRKDK